MAKVYTALEMREVAFFTADHDTAAMLRQAADSLEREERRAKKYEYTHKYGDDVIAVNHTDDVRKCFVPMGAVMVRREVGEWEEVEDGK